MVERDIFIPETPIEIKQKNSIFDNVSENDSIDFILNSSPNLKKEERMAKPRINKTLLKSFKNSDNYSPYQPIEVDPQLKKNFFNKFLFDAEPSDKNDSYSEESNHNTKHDIPKKRRRLVKKVDVPVESSDDELAFAQNNKNKNDPKKRRRLVKKETSCLVDFTNEEEERLLNLKNLDLNYEENALKLMQMEFLDYETNLRLLKDNENDFNLVLDILKAMSLQEEESNPKSESSEAESDTEEPDYTEFFNTCSEEDFYEATNSNAYNEWKLVYDLRPFTSNEDLRTKFIDKKKQKTIEKILFSYNTIIKSFLAVDKIILKCESIGEKVKTSLKKKYNFDLDKDLYNNLTNFKFSQPNLFTKELFLKNYQLAGVCWMSQLYAESNGCILADEMGLGKTTQIVGLLAHLLECEDVGPHLIVVPASVLENWLREFNRFCPKIKVIIYHGSQNERFQQRQDIMDKLVQFQVLVTTYNIPSSHKDERSFLRKLKFKSMILDEGHMMKNFNSNRYKHLISLNIKMRILLTGTPIQNNLSELLALLTFILPDLLTSGLTEFEQESIQQLFNLKNSNKTEDANSSFSKKVLRVKSMLTPFILRRSKCMVSKDLPKKVSEFKYCEATVTQRKVYDKVLIKAGKFNETEEKSLTEKEKKLKAEKQLKVFEEKDLLSILDISEEHEKNDKKNKKKSGKKKVASCSEKNYTSNVLMEMRKAANHPLLMREIYNEEILRKIAKAIMKEPEYLDANEEYIFEDLCVMSDFEIHQLCTKFSYTLKKFQLKSDSFLESGKVLQLKNLLPMLISKDGRTAVDERQNLIDDFTNDEENKVFLLSTKACGLGLNLTCANVVIIHDMDFNPHNDAQAEDRVHRVGQQKEVIVIRLVLKDSIEERISELADLKLKLDNEIKN
ncbi:ATP-dependent helicase smarcad1 [Clydaea vesicula]|uniref:ATP-dependent helicase smarcad1 n=1 Tax=Clydaea vesicula TaxID=447962 RepID=A0AAD5U3S2_9FUNG|nr:ATP-dependent helicase smarcad1 [Clydaea vesicula]